MEPKLEPGKSFVPSIGVIQMGFLRDMYFKGSRDAKLRILHSSMHPLLQPLSSSSHQEFAAHVFQIFWRRHPFNPLYICDTRKRMDTPSVKHGYPCIGYMKRKDDTVTSRKDSTG